MTDDPASPVCFGDAVDSAYMGYAGHDELVAALTELLEAERAGARVALESRKKSSDPGITDLLNTVHADEARWCAMLSQQIRRLGADPSAQVGAFHLKAMSIVDLGERLALLNRGQAWVVRKLIALRPRVRDDALHAALTSMLASHETNIDATDILLKSRALPLPEGGP